MTPVNFLDKAFNARKQYDNFLKLIVDFKDSTRTRDINPAQFFFLARIYLMDKGERGIGEIHEKAFIGTNSHYNSNQLEKYNYIKRTTPEFDKRMTLIELTQKSRNIVEKFLEYLSNNSDKVNNIFKEEPAIEL